MGEKQTHSLTLGARMECCQIGAPSVSEWVFCDPYTLSEEGVL